MNGTKLLIAKLSWLRKELIYKQLLSNFTLNVKSLEKERTIHETGNTKVENKGKPHMGKGSQKCHDYPILSTQKIISIRVYKFLNFSYFKMC